MLMTMSTVQLSVHSQRKPARRRRKCNVTAINTTLASTFKIEIHTHGVAELRL